MKLAVFIAGVVCAHGLGQAAKAQISFHSLGVPAGFSGGVYGTALSRDGSVVAAHTPFVPFRYVWWDTETGYQEHQSPYGVNVPYALTPDGGTAVGVMQPSLGELEPFYAFRRVRGSAEPERLVGMSYALAVSDDGRTIFGNSENRQRSVLWRDGVITDLGQSGLGGAVSGDGRTATGPDFVWREQFGLTSLPGAFGLATRRDGSEVFGYLTQGPTRLLPTGFFRWTDAGGVEDLGRPSWVPPGLFDNSPKRVFSSDDGGVVVFTGYGPKSLWTRERGFERISTLLEGAGLISAGAPFSIGGLSGDGRTMLVTVGGLGGSPAIPYLVTLPAPGSAAVLAGAMVFAARRRR